MGLTTTNTVLLEDIPSRMEIARSSVLCPIFQVLCVDSIQLASAQRGPPRRTSHSESRCVVALSTRILSVLVVAPRVFFTCCRSLMSLPSLCPFSQISGIDELSKPPTLIQPVQVFAILQQLRHDTPPRRSKITTTRHWSITTSLEP